MSAMRLFDIHIIIRYLRAAYRGSSENICPSPVSSQSLSTWGNLRHDTVGDVERNAVVAAL